jgi:hypothetical protein
MLATSKPYADAAGSCALAPETTPTTATATAAAARDIAAPAATLPPAAVAAATAVARAVDTCQYQGPEPGSGDRQPSRVHDMPLTKKVCLACFLRAADSVAHAWCIRGRSRCSGPWSVSPACPVLAQWYLTTAWSIIVVPV